jgi:hypothetical protein
LSHALRRLLPVVLLGALPLASLALGGIPGQIALYPMLGVFPGMAVAGWLAGRGRFAPRWTLGLALSPLVAVIAGALLMRAGLDIADAARVIAFAGLALWALGELTRRDGTAEEDEPAPDRRFVLGLGILLAVLVAIPWLVNPFLRLRMDSWVHGGLVWEIFRHGLPPEDPRFAGMRLNYVWCFNLYIALLTSLGARDPFVNMALFNTLNIAVCVALAYRAGLTLWRDRVAAAGSALLVTLGLNAGAWILWPLRLVRAMTGDVRGIPEIRNQLRELHFDRADIIFNLDAPFAHMLSFVDKFTIGTALSYAWLMMLLYLWALLRWLDGGRGEALVWAVAGAAGMLFFHGVVGLSVLPVALGTLALTWILGARNAALPARGRIAAFAAATLVGVLIAAPYTRAISSGWAADKSGIHNQYLRPGWVMMWTIATSCAVTLWFARRPLARILRERMPAATVLLLFTLAMTVFGCIVHLPLDNESKFAFEVFFPLALIGGAAFLPETHAFMARHGRVTGGVVFALLFLLAPALTLYGYSVDPERHTSPALNPAPGETTLYKWIRDSTEANSVFTDRGGRDLIMVEGQRRLWVGTISGPDKAGFPSGEMDARRAVEADLYGSGVATDRDAASLLRLGRPIYVLYRAADFASAEPWRTVEQDIRFGRVYDRDGFVVLRLGR